MKQKIIIFKKLIKLSCKAKSICRPNPAVAAIILKNNIIIGEGYTQAIGHEHAEVMAIKSVKQKSDLPDSELVVSLSPCCIHGNTPPCTDFIIFNKIKKVSIVFIDPNPKMLGDFNENISEIILKKNGIEVKYFNINEKNSIFMKLYWNLFLINLDFFKQQIFTSPSITIKYAMTLDGKMANHEGKSKWISGIAARKMVHVERSYHDSIMVGAQTFINDNPKLNVRTISPVKQPLPIVVISQDIDFIKVKKHSLLKSNDRVLFLVHKNLSNIIKKITAIKNKRVKIFPDKNNFMWYHRNFLSNLAQEYNLNSFYAEGGSALQSYLISSGLVDRFSVYIAPVVFLGLNGLSPFESKNIKNKISYFPPYKLWKVTSEIFEDNILVRGIYQKEIVDKIWQHVLPK